MLGRWMTVLFVGLGAGLAGCQVIDDAGREAQVTQALEGEHCGAPMPEVKTWDGTSALPAPTAKQIYVVLEQPGSNEQMIAGLVDAGEGKVVSAVQIARKQLGEFVTALGDYPRIVIPGWPPPPPDVTGEILMSVGMQHLRATWAAQEDIAFCQQL